MANRTTNCYKGKCQIDDETSGLTFNPYLWGPVPQYVRVGSHWEVKIDKLWEAGPVGTEQVRVVSVAPVNGEITLTRHGSGKGPSSNDRYMADVMKNAAKAVTITTSDGKDIDVTMVPGEATWDGYTTVSKGVIIGDEIMVTQQVRFVAKYGQSYPAELRVYTLLDLAHDSI